LVDNVGRHDQHCRLQLVDRKGESLAVRNLGFNSEICGAHFPLAAQNAQQSTSRCAKARFFLSLSYTPQGVQVRHHTWSDKSRLASSQFSIKNFTASDKVVL